MKAYVNRLIIMVITFSSVAMIYAEENYRFHFLTTNDGLSNNNVECMLVDSKGLLWIGTETGLDRYDGYRVKSMRQFLNPEFGQSQVVEIQEDDEENIWFALDNTYVVYSYDTHAFVYDVTAFLKSRGIEVDSAYQIKIDDAGGMWILQDGKLMRYDNKSGHVETWNDRRFHVEGTIISKSSAISTCIVLVDGAGVWKFTRNTGLLEKIDLPAEMETKTDMYGTFFDAERSLWIYSTIKEQICRYNVGGKIVKQLISLPTQGSTKLMNNAIRHLMDDGQGRVWIATDHQGVYIYHKESDAVVHLSKSVKEPNSLSSDNVTFLERDKRGNVWAGHFKTGITTIIASNGLFTTKGRQYGDVTAVFSDSKGNVWLGTDGNGLYVEFPDGSFAKTALPDITIMSLTEDEDGNIWAGSYSYGVFKLHGTGAYEQFSQSLGNFPENCVWNVVSDGTGHLWCCSSIGSLIRMDTHNYEYQEVKDENGNMIQGNDLCLDGKGHLLVASTYGIVVCDIHSCKAKRYITNRSGSQELSYKMITRVVSDPVRNLILMIYKYGAFIYDLNHDRLYDIGGKNEHLNLSTKSVVKDSNGNFWISTASGITWISVHQRAEGMLGWHIRSFTSHDGLQQEFFNGTAAVDKQSGRLLFGGVEGYTVVNPEKIDEVPSGGNTPIIIDVNVEGRPVPFGKDGINLHSSDKYIRIEYFPGDLNRAAGTRYAYKIVGMMTDWTYTNENYLSLVGLASGNYQLLIHTAYGEEDAHNECLLNIHVAPPFYKTTLAYILYAGLVCGLVYLLWRRFRRLQMEKLHKQEEELEREKMIRITEMKLQFFTNISHDLRTPLTLILSPIDHIVKKLEKGATLKDFLPQLKNIRKNARLLYNQVGALLDFRRLDVGAESLQPSMSDIVAQVKGICLSFDDYAKERKIPLSFTCEKGAYEMWYDKMKMSKILYNLLSNAFKFTEEGGRVDVSLRIADGHAVIAVADTGKSISDDEKEKIFHRFYQSSSNRNEMTGSGIGLHIVNEYVRMHQGTIEVSDNQPKGCVFTLCIPVTIPDKSPQEENFADKTTDVTTSEKRNNIVLVVDDNADILDFVMSSLSDEYHVLTASNGQQALDILAEKEVNLIISDVMMPGIDGFELCRRVKSDISTSHIPVILLTARTTDDSRLEGLQIGADDYITKPFNIDVLQLRVRKFTEWAEKSHLNFRKKVDVSPSEITITPLDEQFIRKAVEVVEKHMSDSEFSVETLGHDLCMSRSNLYKKLMAITGLGPLEFIRTIRIKRGRDLLEHSQMQITEIAYMVGYNSLKSFTMNFKSEYGMTPSEYVKGKRGEKLSQS